MNKELLAYLAEIEAIRIESYGMRAENDNRILNGLTLAYGDEEFFEVSGRLFGIADKIRELKC